MAFSSLFSYMQDPLVPHHRRSDAALKRYESAKDPRAWSLDRQEKADFIHKIVKHRTACESSSDSNEASGFETAEIDGMSREQLLKLVKDLYGKIKVAYFTRFPASLVYFSFLTGKRTVEKSRVIS